MTKQIKKILIANRSEIALRVIKTCQEMGIKTVTLYTSKESDLPHAKAGDESFNFGQGSLADTYLNQEKIIELALKSNACAIHPGYGFLSENALFCKKVKAAGLIFIGPSEESMQLMGSKKNSKQKMQEIGVPVVPGYHGEIQEADYLLKEAKKIGFPVLIKASAGGGGKGMRVVHQESEFNESLASAKREAKNAFGDEVMLIEKYIMQPRHIEVQVLSDSHGHHLHLFERECSIQRRHQKIIEETPSPALTENKRKEMTDSAINITKNINYLGAGTVEFIFDENDNFYFLEMNTRLQVEHPVTEMVVGIDLVKQQILVAQGEALSLSQEQIKQTGHAIEVRIYAEDPDNSFMPSTDRILYIGQTAKEQSRLDCGYKDGNMVSTDFDPMLAKLSCWGDDRNQAINEVLNELDHLPFLGLITNRDYLKRILKTNKFVDGELSTNFVNDYKDQLAPQELNERQVAVAIATMMFADFTPELNFNKQGQNKTAWDRLIQFRNV
ncbi:hypothetical protein BVY03_02685 [bacterium K02(2017)]|nr:hypothetical protein BVY03_02685 [bacterium K02(2017)]